MRIVMFKMNDETSPLVKFDDPNEFLRGCVNSCLKDMYRKIESVNKYFCPVSLFLVKKKIERNNTQLTLFIY